MTTSFNAKSFVVTTKADCMIFKVAYSKDKHIYGMAHKFLLAASLAKLLVGELLVVTTVKCKGSTTSL